MTVEEGLVQVLYDLLRRIDKLESSIDKLKQMNDVPLDAIMQRISLLEQRVYRAGRI